MKSSKHVLLHIQKRLSVMSDNKLQEMLKFQKSTLEKIIQTYSEENAQYLRVSVEQKITLIENELKHREELKTQQV